MNNKVVAYSLLAHINESQHLSKNYEDIFVPLVMRILAKMSRVQKFEGADISEIKAVVDEDYGWDIPPATLKRLLQKVEIKINSQAGMEKMKVYGDGSFSIKAFTFDEYDEEIDKKNKELAILEEVYKDFLKSEDLDAKISITSIYDFVEESKISLGKYINKKYQKHSLENTVEARFINFISSIPSLYSIFQSIYIGAIISTYLEYEPKEVKKEVELVLDTNFVISLLDLNTPQSTQNCKKLLVLAQKLGYKFTILGITLREIDSLLSNRVEYFDTSFLSSLVNPEDIYNACQRRGITKTDLEKIRNDVEKEVSNFSISIVTNTEKYENRAKHSEDFENLKQFRNTYFAALHDAACIDYVKIKRGKAIHDFSRVNCWFVNNSSRRNSYSHTNGIQPVYIKAEDLLNMLWLSSPRIKRELSTSEVAIIGLSRLVASTLNDTLPKATIIKQLDYNIAKYAKEDISDEDIIRVAKSIGQRSVADIEQLNELAESKDVEFVKKLREVASNQKIKEDEQFELLNRALSSLSNETQLVKQERKTIENARLTELEDVTSLNGSLVEQIKKEKLEKIRLQNSYISEKRRVFEKRKIFEWRRISYLQLAGSLAFPFVIVFIASFWNPSKISTVDWVWGFCKGHLLLFFIIIVAYAFIPGFIINGLSLKYNNHSNIMSFQKDIIYPQDLYLIDEDV